MPTKILITGASGFIGSHLAELCVELGYDVRAFCRYNSKNNWGWLENSQYSKDMEIVTGDIRDYDSVQKAMRDRTAVFHLAALIGIPYSYISPLAYIKTNIEGTYNVLQAALQTEPDSILVTSTSETYGSAQYIPIDERHPSVGQSPYSASKIGADQLSISFHRSFQLPVRIARPFNTFGPRQSARAIIPTIITQLLNGERKIKLGNLLPTRDFTFVSDTIAAMVEISKCESLIGESTNIGMNKEISISDLVSLIASSLAVDVEVKGDKQRERSDSSEVDTLVCDNRKILEHTDWRPQLTLREGLGRTIQWIRENISSFKSDIYNV
ncbi:conserved protein of unknown function [uncultured Woeseiaceae bacterium]|uniref:NAD(P)-binding domain-containing protein n=1 Tax=uncultured Woeseiaceae bacterium TaxID=1983305 RepID=A0A7D9D1C1_9GAMM|nr:conserved protein of unknown function [uncultured Woeseiaceae bacterium]